VKTWHLLSGLTVVLLGVLLLYWLNGPGSVLPANSSAVSNEPEQAPEQVLLPDGRQGSLPDDLSREDSAGDRRLSATMPGCELVPVLPGIEDLEISTCTGGHLSLVLAREGVDNAWAPGMEARLREQIAAYEQVQFVRAEAVCRYTACGVLLILTEGERGEFVPTEYSRILIESLGESIGFRLARTVNAITDDGLQFILGFLEHAEGREAFWPDPGEPQRVEALPGITGYELTRVESPPNFRFPMSPELLAAEAVDPAWAPVMEGRILGELALLGAPVNQMHVVCRTTRCGVVVDYVAGIDLELKLNATTNLIRRMESLGLGSCPSGTDGMPYRTNFAALYFEERSGGGCSMEVAGAPPR
jgi:hypothetical protein